MKPTPLPRRDIPTYLWWQSLGHRMRKLVLVIVLVVVGVGAVLYFTAMPDPSADAQRASSTGAPEGGAPNGFSATQVLQDGVLPPTNAETRLLEVLALIEQARIQEAYEQARALVSDQPQFQLAQLILGDLQRLRFQPEVLLGNVPPDLENAAARQLEDLRLEARQRIAAISERPPVGTVPHQFVAVSPWSRHAIAVDASLSRLYLFENRSPDGNAPPRLELKAHYYISMGKSGISKLLEGDNKTPLGIYYITSRREGRTLPDFYGPGALPINYPNPIDVLEQRTGSGIWLHGSPTTQFARPPLASEGCVVLSNPDMQDLLDTVDPQTTPVVIAPQLQWVAPAALQADQARFKTLIDSWQRARSLDDIQPMMDLLSTRQTPANRGYARASAQRFMVDTQARLGTTGLSLLRWHEDTPFLVATFEETLDDAPTGVVRRQYWGQEASGWKLVYDAVLSGTPSPALQRATPTRLASAPTPAPATPAEPASAAADPQTLAVTEAVNTWAAAWSRKDMAAYLDAYHPDFVPPDGLSRAAWQQQRTARIVPRQRIQVGVSRLSVAFQGQQATATFLQDYQSDGLEIRSRKALTLQQHSGRWRIVREVSGG